MAAVVPPENSAQQKVNGDEVKGDSARGAMLSMQRIDIWCEKWGDWCNPILVKETRQALKSRQFVITFSLLLVAALSWTIIGTVSLMPAIYDTPSAPRMLLGYYFVLALPMLLVVPLAAYRSLEGEIDDGTLELLSITALSPKQIVLGKLASAMLQMLLYFVVLFPCVSYAYTLRGVDFPTTVVLLGMLVIAGIMMTIVALFFAPLSRSRTGRVTMLLVVIMLLVGAEWLLGLAAFELIFGDGDWQRDMGFSQISVLLGGVLLVVPAVAHLFLTLAAAQLTPMIENRSTKIRVALLVVNATVAAWIALGFEDSFAFVQQMFLGGVGLMFLWVLASSMFVSESAVLTPRVQRTLPQSFLGRATLTWLAPGPATGLVFSVLNILLLLGMLVGAFVSLLINGFVLSSNGGVLLGEVQTLLQFSCAVAAYMTCFLVLVYGVMKALRRNNNPRVEVGFAALVVVAVFSALGPYGIQLYLNDFLEFPYSHWQATNWVWTLYNIADGVDCSGVIKTLGTIGVLGVLGVMFMNPALVRPRRTATPERVLEELEKNRDAAAAPK